MTDIQSRLNNLKIDIEKGKTEKTRAEANLESYTKQREEIVAQMKEMGVTPETVETEIEKLGNEIQENLSKAESLLGR
jgi:chromosome segregation ATPase